MHGRVFTKRQQTAFLFTSPLYCIYLLIYRFWYIFGFVSYAWLGPGFPNSLVVWDEMDGCVGTKDRRMTLMIEMIYLFRMSPRFGE